MIRKNIHSLWGLALAAVLLGVLGCTKQSLEPSLKQNIPEDDLSTVTELQAAVGAAYNFMSDDTYYGRDYIIFNEVRSDNCFSTGNSNRFINFWNPLLKTDGSARDTWLTMYKVIGQCNFVIGKENVQLEGDADQKKDIVGQAYALRALAHFDLLKLYGAMHVTAQSDKGIPYVTEWRGENTQPGRTSPEEVQKKLYADLDAALERLAKPQGRVDAAYVNFYAAHALKARVAQWFGDWAVAEAEAKAVIDGGAFRILTKDEYIGSWSKKFNPNSLFEMSYNASDNPSIDGIANIYGGDGYGDVVPTPELVELLRQDANDVRSQVVDTNKALLNQTGGALGYYLANMVKFPNVFSYDDNVPLVRYEEVVLIYAEALMHNGNAAEALTQLNSIAENRGAAAYTEATEETILQERRKELCFEGFRFDDMARTKQGVPRSKAVDEGQYKRSYDYGSVDFSFPIPHSELNANPNLSQNAGY